MSHSKLFSLSDDLAQVLTGSSTSLECNLQQQNEASMPVPMWGLSYPK
ncbi:MAG: hypothetical protein H6999_12535 [Hahellaceae bacterium]|nr:hypothetical protein [Hahellaceae bacterium]MCP5170570.1 hypothetical protein [Hahellaceae bacterium]